MTRKDLRCAVDLKPVIVRSSRRPTVYCTPKCREEAKRYRREAKKAERP